MEFKALAGYFKRIEDTSKRLEMYGILAELIAEGGASEIDKVIYLSQGQLLPPFAGVEIGISEKLMLKAVAEAAGVSSARVEAAFRESGDLGLTAEALLHGERSMAVSDVYGELSAIASTSGKGSMDQKVNLLASLLRGVTPIEARYVTRFVVGRLRLGVGDPTVIEALALSAGDRALKADIERAYNLCSDLGLVARTLKEHGMDAIRAFRIKPGYPVRMALCERLPSSADIIAKMGRAAIEAKYDGFRCQVHKDGPKVEIFSRNLERTTPMFPEIAAAVAALPVRSLIMEGEAIAYNEDTGELMPFQVTIKRKRKHGIEDAAAALPLRFFAFELLLVDGEDYTGRPYQERRARLVSLIEQAGNPALAPARMIETGEPAEIDSLFTEFVETGLEGIIAKRLDSAYTAGSRNFNWIKLKRSYRGELADTLDLCVVGYYLGKGGRARFGIGALLGAVYDKDSDTFKTVARVGSGFTEAELVEVKALLDAAALKHRHPRVHSVADADVWVTPRYVITVTADEITQSPSHTAGTSGEGGTGYALRFPRATGMPRADKSPEDATTSEEVVSMFNQQKKVKTA